jgi:hypothetical protein
MIKTLHSELNKSNKTARNAHHQIIKALVELVTMHQTDKQYNDEVLSRDAVMEKVTSIRYAADALFKSTKQKGVKCQSY